MRLTFVHDSLRNGGLVIFKASIQEQRSSPLSSLVFGRKGTARLLTSLGQGWPGIVLEPDGDVQTRWKP